jgi:hypothetical protein
MNFTIALLSVGSLNPSPFSSSSTHHFLSRYSFSRIHAIRLFRSFSVKLLPAKYSRRTFAHILNSAISVSDRRISRREGIELALASPEDDLVEATDSTFRTRSQYNGRAINMLRSGSTLTVSRSGFFSCSAVNRGGAISFFGQILRTNSACFVSCESSEAAMAVEAQLDRSNSTCDLDNILVNRCAGLQDLPGPRFASLYFMFGSQTARGINSTQNDCSLGAFFCGSEDSVRFDFQFCSVEGGTGKSGFELEDLALERSVFAFVNIIGCRAGEAAPTELTLFGLLASNLVLQKSCVFNNVVKYLAVRGALTFVDVRTDLLQTVAVLKCEFSSRKSEFGVRRMKTAKLPVFNTDVCYGGFQAQPQQTPLATALSFVKVDPNSGTATFLGITGLSAAAMFFYYAFGKTPPGSEKLDGRNLVNVEIAE